MRCARPTVAGCDLGRVDAEVAVDVGGHAGRVPIAAAVEQRLVAVEEGHGVTHVADRQGDDDEDALGRDGQSGAVRVADLVNLRDIEHRELERAVANRIPAGRDETTVG